MNRSNHTPNQLAGAPDSAWFRRMHAVDRFDERWQADGHAVIADFLPAEHAGERRELLVELIKVDLEYRWRRGERVHVEDYLQQFPELGDAAAVPLELIVEELQVRAAQGSSPSDDELSARFPGRVAELHAALECGGSTPLLAAPDESGTNQKSGDESPHSKADGTRSVPATLGRYELREQVGRGGFATVWRAYDPELRREVAIKVPRPELIEAPGFRERIEREVQAAARLRHPAIVPIFEVGHAGDGTDDGRGTTFIVYEFVHGPTLAKLLEQTKPSPQQAAEWIAVLAEALDYAHQNGIVHRDVKPANVMMEVAESGEQSAESQSDENTSDGKSSLALRPKLTDFGLALHADAGATLTQQGDILGTPAYMSPEQARGEGHSVDARTDVYSLGVMLYEMLAGRRPFEGSGPSVLQRVLDEEPPALRSVRPGVPLDLDTICQRAMAKEASRRYTTAGAMAADLRAWLEHRPILARRVGALGRFALWCRRKPALAATIAAAALVSLTVCSASFIRVVAERNRFRTERDRAEANLYLSLVREARAIRLARSTGYRAQAWSRLEQAHQLNTPDHSVAELRQEAVASMGDFVGLAPRIWSPRSQPKDYVVAIAPPDDRGQFALGLADGSVVLCNIANGEKRVRMHRQGGGVFDVSYDAERQTVYAVDDAGGIGIWQPLASGEWTLRRTISTSASLRPNHVNAISLARTPDGTQLLACPRGADSIAVWDLATGAASEPIRLAEAQHFLSVTASRDGRWLVAPFIGKGGAGVAVWELATRKVVQLLYPGLGSADRVVFSGDGRLLACACSEGVALFRTADFQAHLFVKGDSPYMVSFSPDDRWLAIPSPNRGVVRLWDVAVNREVAVLRHEIVEGSQRIADEPHTAVFSADGGSLIAISANWVHVWNLRGIGDKLVLSGHHGSVSDVAFHPEGRLLASGGADRTVKLWDTTTGRLMRSLDRCDSSLMSIAFAPDGRTLATGEQIGSIWLWDIDPSGESRGRTHLPHDLGTTVEALAFSPDGNYLAAGAEHGVQIWRVVAEVAADGTGLRRRYEPHTRLKGRSVYGLCFSPDSTLLAWRDFDHQRHLWEMDGSRARDLPRPENRTDMGGMAFLPDGQHAVYLAGGEAELWDIERGQLADSLGRIESAGQGNWYTGYKLALHPEGTLLAAQFLNVPIWDVRQKRLLLELPREPDVPTCLAWSPNGQQLAIGSNDGGLVVWNLPVVRTQLAEIGLAW